MKHKHADEIIKWALNQEAEVWTRTSTSPWAFIPVNPNWALDQEYRTILPEYKEAWSVYLDGELEYYSILDNQWRPWTDKEPPIFSVTKPEHFRRARKANVWLSGFQVECNTSQEAIDVINCFVKHGYRYAGKSEPIQTFGYLKSYIAAYYPFDGAIGFGLPLSVTDFEDTRPTVCAPEFLERFNDDNSNA
ncbi:MAG: hypothetical protein CL489_06315 [Acidobacteria bacterium]|nr:hypothetical protein [Acidobacteriota bacterium]|tara:strand:- start:43620 stop:44192 length:573 start_codon:yes stop_codon:yes gene_type:complete